MSLQNLLTRSDEIKERVVKAIESIRVSNPAFENAHYTYTQEYGKDVISVNDPINLVASIDPVILVLGRNTLLRLSDERRTISGSLGSLTLRVGHEYIIGRRQPQDSTLVVWGTDGSEIELERYNPEAGIIPSRIHGAIVLQDEEHVFYTDLCSSSGTVIVGELKHRGAFICVYDPGSVQFPRIKLNWISTDRRA